MSGWICLQALLPPGMVELLRLAAEGGAEGAGPWPRVHAFNTLRLAFIERILAVSATPFVADGAYAGILPSGHLHAQFGLKFQVMPGVLLT